jgi:hypothetical protein
MMVATGPLAIFSPRRRSFRIALRQMIEADQFGEDAVYATASGSRFFNH